LSCQVPIWLALHTIIGRRVTAFPQRWSACRRDVWRFRVHPSFSGVAKSFVFTAGAASLLAIDDITISAVPESSTALLMLAGVAGLAGLRRRRD